MSANGKHYASYCFWLENSGDDLTPRPSLDGSTEVDVAILGAGFSGLWTAYQLLRRDPALDVLVVEKEIAGFGASGRNGGWCCGDFPLSPAVMAKRYGVDAARAVTLAMIDAVDDVERVCAEEGTAARKVRGGALAIARAAYDLPKIEEMWREYVDIGLGDRVG